MAAIGRNLFGLSTRLAAVGAVVVTLGLGAAGVVNTAAAAQIMPSPEAQARYNEYMRTIVPVYFPAVPFGWDVKVENNTVSYIHAEAPDPATGRKASPGSATTIKMRYTRKTSRMDAAAYMDNYVNTHSCELKVKQGTGFYTTACMSTNTYAIVIGEVDNMYIIELIGQYNSAARAIIEHYVGSIVNGKHVFADRTIGDMTDRDK